jgi:hypothetical protein
VECCITWRPTSISELFLELARSGGLILLLKLLMYISLHY